MVPSTEPVVTLVDAQRQVHGTQRTVLVVAGHVKASYAGTGALSEDKDKVFSRMPFSLYDSTHRMQSRTASQVCYRREVRSTSCDRSATQ